MRNTRKEDGNEKREEKGIEKPPEDFFKAIFADSDDESDLNDESGEERKSPADVKDGEMIEEVKNESTIEQPKFITVMDLVQSDNEEFGPAPPPPSSQPGK